MKNIDIKFGLTLPFMAMLLCACSSDIIEETTPQTPTTQENAKMSFNAGIEGDNDTRTTTSFANNSWKTSWSGGENIKIYNPAKNEGTNSGVFTNSSTSSSNNAEFTGPSISNKGADATNTYYAFYPNEKCSGSDAGTQMTLAPIQKASTSIQSDYQLMTGYAESNEIRFKNVCSFLKITIKSSDDFKIGVVKIVSNKDANGNYAKIAGTFTTNINGEGINTGLTGTSTSVEIRSEESADGTTPLLDDTYYIAVLPVNLTAGFTLYLEDVANNKVYQRVAGAFEFGRSKVLDLGTYDATQTSVSSKIISDVVDLGLPSGTLWATKNVAAGDVLFVANESDYGQYYAWGEDFGFDETPNTTEGQYTNINTSYTNMSTYVGFTRYRTKIKYEWNTYKWSSYTKNGIIYTNRTVGKYNSTDGLTELTGWVSSSDKGDDIAQIKSQGKYEMPTKAQFDELTSTNNTSMNNQCRSSIFTDKSKYGINYTSNIVGYTSRSIWLPAAGATYGDSDITDFVNKDGHKHNVDERLAYWTKTLAPNVDQAYCYDYGSSEFLQSNQTIRNGYDNRYAGRNIRPVVKR